MAPANMKKKKKMKNVTVLYIASCKNDFVAMNGHNL